MGDFIHNDNSGSVFVNDRKTKENQPDRTGEGKISCPDCGASFGVWISGWIKRKAGKKPFMSLAFTPKDPPVSGPKSTAGTPADDFDDDIPF